MAQNYDFNNTRYVTSGIQETIPTELQRYLWSLIDKRVADHQLEVDYLQVITLEPTIKDGREMLSVKHSQEEPLIVDNYEILQENTISACKIFIIDDVSHSTMLFGSEY